jgi:hypothetical protein
MSLLIVYIYSFSMNYPLVNFNSSTLKMTNFASGKDCLPSPMTGRVELLIYQRVIH